MSGHPEYTQNEEFHESQRFAPKGEQKVALVDIDETICFYEKERRYDMAVGHMANLCDS